ncbi:MBL fold metallo-hydrolase [Acidimicrobiaceae bacterium USS-CC1]|uniref:MBL fold metallo-hydrolase n=1 Tax=Acidiferrimicrobium australe TaxID=2664430 RepID=A0ABW9QTI8_9ACTN|nr:MBL fold metallo-hydrolase [Acidiferrimicrobium australe]
MELFVLPLGECCCDYEVIAPGVRDGHRVHIPVNAFLIRLPDDRLVLVDTGMSRLHVRDPELTWRGTPNGEALLPAMRKEDSLLFRLAQLEVAPQDIDFVINTHLHFDHAGNNDLLGRATFFVQRDQYEQAKGNPSFPNQYWNLPSLSYELLDGATELWGGIEVRATPGHCEGHQSVVVRLPETGTVILCGDAVYCQDNFDRDAWDGQADPELARQSAHELRHLAEHDGALMVYGHDPEQFHTLRKAPEASYR